MNRPIQAVILAGGRGERLRPFTDNMPKPMIEFHGKPFLEYLIEMLRDQGFTRILLLLGYLPKIIQDYFGDGSPWGVEIEYSVTDVENDTGRRLKLAQNKIDSTFLMLYCDNYWPLRFDEMWEIYKTHKVMALVTAYRNLDHYTRDNLRIDNNGYVLVYDKSRVTPDLSGVDIGFMIMNHSVLDLLSEGNVSFEREVYPHLIAQHQLLAYITDHRYYSIGGYDRLPLTEAFLKRSPTVLLDRDGVLNKKAAPSHYICSWEDWEWLPGAKDALRLYKENGYRVIVISNQAGIARGSLTEADLNIIHHNMKEEAIEAGGQIDAIYYCPHHWDDGCSCRKPKPGMLFQAQRDFSLDLSRTYFLGDDERDGQAAGAAGALWEQVSEENTLLDITLRLLSVQKGEKA